jgi:hypothetical protein
MIEAWLAARDGSAPAALAARVRALASAEGTEGAEGASDPSTGDVGIGGSSEPAVVLVRATGGVLQRLLREQETPRASALELLAADALATYAMEALGDAPESIESRCAWAMRYLAEAADSA